jgi:hypothetical protein
MADQGLASHLCGCCFAVKQEEITLFYRVGITEHGIGIRVVEMSLLREF